MTYLLTGCFGSANDLLAWLVTGAVVILVMAMGLMSRRSEAQLVAARQEMQNSLAAQSQMVTAQMSQQINHLTQTVNQRLDQVRRDCRWGRLHCTTDSRRPARRLPAPASSTDAIQQMNQKIGEIQQWGQDLSKATHTLESILGGAKTRGTLGEAALDRLLADALPQNAYSTQLFARH